MDFKHMVPHDFAAYKPFFSAQQYTLCGYALSSIIAWSNEEYQPFGAFRDDALIVAAEFATKCENRHLILPISPKREYQPEELFDLALELGYSTFWFVPEDYIERQGREQLTRYFSIVPHEAYDDYVFRTEDLAFLKGNKYSKKRNLINQFEREFDANGNVQVEAMGPANADECLAFLEQWCAERDGCDGAVNTDLACEKQAAITTIENLEQMELKGILVRLDNVVSAFGISSALTQDMATLQYEKAFSGVKGLYQYLDRECARRLFEGFTYINKESNMGMPGIAKSKRSYYPAMMVKAYKLVVK
jgi:hypothetical protein